MTRGDFAVLGALAMAQVLFLIILASRGYFSMDELRDFGVVGRTGYSWQFLNGDLIGGHWAPGGHSLLWFVNATSHLNWNLALAITLPFAVVALLLMDRVLRAVGTTRYLRYGLLAVFALSPVLVRPAAWFASGVQALPGLAFMLVCIDGFVRYRSTRQRRYWLECVAGFVVGLLFWESSLFLIGCLPLLALVLAPSRLGVKSVGRELRESWTIWITLLVIGAFYLWNYEANVAIPQAHPSGSLWLSFIRTAWTEALVPASFGIARQRPVFGETTTIIVTELLFTGFVALTIWRTHRAWRVWLLFAIVFTINAGIVGWDRATFGPLSIVPLTAVDLRYQAPVLPFLFLAVVLALKPRTAHPAARSAEQSSTHPARRGHRSVSTGSVVTLGVVLIFLCVYALLATRSGIWLADHSPGLDPGQSYGTNIEAPKPYFSHMRTDLARLSQRDRVIQLYDEPLPVVWYGNFPYGLASKLLPQVTDKVAFDGANDPRYIVDPRDGHIHAAEFHVQTVAAQGLGAVAATPAPTCVTAGRASATLATTVTPTLTPGWWTGRLHLLPGSAVRVQLIVDNGHQTYEIADPPGWPDGHTGYFTIPRHTQSFVFSFLAVGHIQGFRFVVGPGQSLCTEGVDFGTAVAR